MAVDRVFVVVCANMREREDVRRLGLWPAGYDRVELLTATTAELHLRGMTIDAWATTAGARYELDGTWRGYALAQMLNARTRRAPAA